MNKPEKKELNPVFIRLNDTSLVIEAKAQGFNKACDDWEKWLDEVLIKTKSEICSLPTEEEISILLCEYANSHLEIKPTEEYYRDTAKALHKRISEVRG